MPHYLAEAYAAQPIDPVPVLLGARLIQSLHVPDDELCFFVFEAPSEADLRQAASAAKLALDRIRAVTPT